MKKNGLSLCLFIGLVIVPPVVGAGDGKKEAESTPLSQSYTGPGRIVILDNGQAIATLSAAEDPQIDDVIILQSRSIAGKALVGTNDGWFIDATRSWNNRKNAVVSAFRTGPAALNPQALLELSGEMRVTYTGAADSDAVLEVLVTAADGTRFESAWTLQSTASPLDPTPAESLDDSKGTESHKDELSTCSVACSGGGSGSITCGANQGCYAYCDGAGAHVGCGRRPVAG